MRGKVRVRVRASRASHPQPNLSPHMPQRTPTPPRPPPQHTHTHTPHQVGVILSALYRARRPGAVTVRAIERAWTVLALKAPQFANVDDRIVQLVSHSKYSYS